MRWFLCMTVYFLSVSAKAQNWSDTTRVLDSIIARYYDPAGPGGQLSVVRDGQLLYTRAFGLADLERKVPLTLESRIEAGSVSKQFTAAAILLLEQQGKLSVEDDVRKYVPELPDYGHVIRIRHLMDHSSGLRDWGSIAVIAGWPRSTKFYNNEDALDIMVRQKALNHVPGAEFIYSNSNYNLMAILVQRVSGMSLAEFTKQQIFEPAGMKHTQWRDDPNRIVPNRAIGYSPDRGGWETDMPNEYVYGNGGLLTTVEDLQAWTSYCLTGQFGKPSLREKQVKAYRFNNGVMNEYGAGLFLQPVGGWPAVQHSGATAGYRAWLVYYPELHLSIAMLFNTPRYFGDAPKAMFNVFAPEKRPAPVAAVAADTALFRQMGGWYRNNRDGIGVLLAVNNGRVTADGFAVQQLTGNSFIHQGERYVLDARSGLQKIFPGKDTMRFDKVSAPAATIPVKDYLGAYYSSETVSTAVIKEKNGQLVLQLKPTMEYTLVPAYKDAFRHPSLGTLYAERDKKGRVIGFAVSVSRARNVRFNKQS